MNILPMKEFMPEYLFLTDKEVIEKRIKFFNMNEIDALKNFFDSETYRMCADVEKSMWDIGSSDIFDMWVVEKITGNPKNVNFMKNECE